MTGQSSWLSLTLAVSPSEVICLHQGSDVKYHEAGQMAAAMHQALGLAHSDF